MNDKQQKKFIDALEAELDGQELMFDEHEWMTLIKCLKEALKVVEVTYDGLLPTGEGTQEPSVSYSEGQLREAIEEILEAFRKQCVNKENTGSGFENTLQALNLYIEEKVKKAVNEAQEEWMSERIEA